MRTVKRRRLEKKTDYKARLNMLKSRLPRIVVRKTNKYIIVQYITSKEGQDSVILGITSKELSKYGLKDGFKSISACYLTGLLLGKKIKEQVKTKKAIFDIGLNRNVKKGKLYAVLKGLIEEGIEINCKKEIFPDEKRIKGEHLKNKIDFEKIKEKILK